MTAARPRGTLTPTPTQLTPTQLLPLTHTALHNIHLPGQFDPTLLYLFTHGQHFVLEKLTCLTSLLLPSCNFHLKLKY